MWLFYLFAPSQSSAPATHLVFGGSEKTKLQYTLHDKSQLLRAGPHLSPTSVSSSQNMDESLKLSAIGHKPDTWAPRGCRFHLLMERQQSFSFSTPSFNKGPGVSQCSIPGWYMRHPQRLFYSSYSSGFQTVLTGKTSWWKASWWKWKRRVKKLA